MAAEETGRDAAATRRYHGPDGVEIVPVVCVSSMILTCTL